MEAVAPYSWAIIALLVFVLVTLVMSALVGARKASAKLTAGGTPDNNYEDALYRMNRSHQNAVENAALIAIALAAAIARLVDDDQLRKRMGAAGQERMKKDFSIDTMARKHVDVYESVING